MCTAMYITTGRFFPIKVFLIYDTILNAEWFVEEHKQLCLKYFIYLDFYGSRSIYKV